MFVFKSNLCFFYFEVFTYILSPFFFHVFLTEAHQTMFMSCVLYAALESSAITDFPHGNDLLVITKNANPLSLCHSSNRNLDEIHPTPTQIGNRLKIAKK